VTRPAFLGPEHARAFDDPDVALAYAYRPRYPESVFDLLLRLMDPACRRVIDLGAGRGEIARQLVRHADHVDAIEPSAAMVERGRRLLGGRDRRLTWIVARAEDAQLDGPYGLAVAGQSLHWMDWDVVLPRIARVLTAGSHLAIVNSSVEPPPWDAELRAIIRRYSRNPTYRELDLIAALTERRLFGVIGGHRTQPMVVTQRLDEYIAAFHAMSSLTRRRLGPDAERFDAEVRDLVRASGAGESVQLSVIGEVVWGRPLEPSLFGSGARDSTV
jgi:SAM-dependent methyltransferase